MTAIDQQRAGQGGTVEFNATAAPYLYARGSDGTEAGRNSIVFT